jgi:hypothetical protein
MVHTLLLLPAGAVVTLTEEVAAMLCRSTHPQRSIQTVGMERSRLLVVDTNLVRMWEAMPPQAETLDVIATKNLAGQLADLPIKRTSP